MADMHNNPANTAVRSAGAQVLAALNAGDLERAEQQARTLIGSAPDAMEAQYAYGLVHLMKGNAAGSISWLEKASAQAPDNAVYQANLGVACLRAGELVDAIVHLTTAVEQQPDYREARYNLGCALLDNGEAEQAFACFSGLAADYPEDAAYVCAAGDAAREMHDWTRAVSLYRKAIDLNPGFTRAYINLAPILMHSGFLDEALALARKAIELDPRQVSPYKTLGDCLFQQEAFDDAMDAYADAYEIDPDSAILSATIGNAWLEVSDFPEAASWFQKAIQLDDTNTLAHCGLARIVKEHGDAAQALELLKPLLEREPDNPDLLVAMADTLWDEGDAEGALQHFRRAQAAQPERIVLHARIGQVLSSSGDVEHAIAEHLQALEENPACIPSLSGLAVIQRGKLEPAYADTMEKMLGNDTLRSGARASLHNGLAFYHDGRKSYESAAGHTRLANASQWDNRSRRGWKYDADKHADYISKLIATFDRGYFERVGKAGSPDRTPVFIVGMPRSGTTLTEQILARHSKVLGIGERNFAARTFNAFVYAGQVEDENDLSRLDNMSGKVIEKIAGSYLQQLQQLKDKAGVPDALRVVDKMPDNYSLLGWILTLFPNARIIHCRRDPRAVALSCWMTQFGSIRWACHTGHLVERIRQYRRIMEHWRSVIPDRFIELDYEQLVANQEAESRRLIEWIGLDWDADCLSFYESDRLIRTASITQVRKPIYKGSVARWKHYEPWLQDLLGPLTEMLGRE